MEIIEIIAGALLIGAGLASAHPAFRRQLVRALRSGRRTHTVLTLGVLLLGVAITLHAALPVHVLPLGVGVIVALLVTLAVGLWCATHRITPRDTQALRRVLVIGAHPDDLELGCSGTLARLIDEGAEVHALIMSNGAVGASGDTAATRAVEAETAARFLGIADVEVHDHPDTNLGLVENHLMQVIESKIRRLQPDLILTHSNHDQHQDHEAVHRATLRAARGHRSILCFESPSATREFSPSVFVDVRDYVDIKVQAVYTHHDQLGKSYMHAGVLTGITAFRGRQARCEHAEGFEPVRLDFSLIGVN